jgi:hypothetical protein
LGFASEWQLSSPDLFGRLADSTTTTLLIITSLAAIISAALQLPFLAVCSAIGA